MKLALVLESPDVDGDWLAGCALSLAVQLQRDVGPAWGMAPPTVDANVYRAFALAPPDSLPIVLLPNSDTAGALGYHDVQRDGRPYARVFTAGMSLADIACTISHEGIEAFCDPTCDRWRRRANGVLYALEPADPVEEQSYDVQGYAMSNFVLPSWFEDTAAAYPVDFLGALVAPWSLSPNGYAIVQDASGRTSTIPDRHAARTEKQHAASRTARRLRGS